MKIIYIASSISIHSLRWIKYFAKNNSIIWITFSRPNKETYKEYIELKEFIKIYNFKNIKDFFKIIFILLLSKYKLVHIHYLGWHSLLSLFIRPNKKIILTPWGSDLLKTKFFLKKIWLRYLFKRSFYTICDSERLKNKAISIGADKNKISILMFGIDTNSYKKSREIFSSNKIIIGSNRKLESIYDIDTFLKAAKNLINSKNNIDFFIAGDGSLRKKYENFIVENKLSSRIKLLGLLNKKEMLDFYDSIDIYISCSLSDGGLSSSIAEAMSFERVIIITKNSDNEIWIKDGVNGYLFCNRDYEALGLIINKIISNKNENKKIAMAGRKLIEKRYSYKIEMNKVQKIYDKC